MTEPRLAGRAIRGQPDRTCGPWPTACSARSARPRTPCRTPGCGSAAPTPAGREPRRLADDGGRACLPRHAARAPTRREEPLGDARARPDRRAARRRRPRARGAAGRLGRAGAAGGARDADARRAARVRPARHVRRAVRRDRADRRPHAGRRPPARQPCPPARAGAPPAGRRLARQREVVDAFLAASRAGDFEALRRGARPRRRAPRRPRAAAPRARSAAQRSSLRRRSPSRNLAAGPGPRSSTAAPVSSW